MKKTWVKREHIYYVPFYKNKSKMLLLGIFLLGIVFFIYQAVTINQLPNATLPWNIEDTVQSIRKKHKQIRTSLGRKQSENEQTTENNSKNNKEINNMKTRSSVEPIKILRGIRLFDYDSYKPNFEGKFRCLDGSKLIPFSYVNDDYCDCKMDGSDEPSTNACSNGRFYCKYQKRHITGRGMDVYIPSSRINDGICDCCDGSDEWLHTNCTNHCMT